jgi:tryptophanyl-tRNA synthetase
MYRLFANPEQVASLRQLLEAGGTGWAVAKEALFEAMEQYFAEPRERYRSLITDRPRLHAILEEGARHARHLAQRRMEKIRRAIGVR